MLIFFETAPLSERREHFLPLGLWNYQGYSRPSGKKIFSAPCESCVSKKSTWRRSSRTRKKKKFSFEELPSFFPYSRKKFRKNLPLSARSEMLIFRDGASQRAQRTFLATGSVKLSGLFTTQWQNIFSAVELPKKKKFSFEVVRLEKSTFWDVDFSRRRLSASSRTRKKIKFSFEELPSGFFRIHGKNFAKKKTLPLSARSEMLIFSRRRLSASAENISCHWVCEIIRVIHDPVAKKFSALPCESCVSKNQHEGGAVELKKKNKKFSFEELPSGFFRIHGKNFEKKLTP